MHFWVSVIREKFRWGFERIGFGRWGLWKYKRKNMKEWFFFQGSRFIEREWLTILLRVGWHFTQMGYAVMFHSSVRCSMITSHLWEPKSFYFLINRGFVLYDWVFVVLWLGHFIKCLCYKWGFSMEIIDNLERITSGNDARREENGSVLEQWLFDVPCIIWCSIFLEKLVWDAWIGGQYLKTGIYNNLLYNYKQPAVFANTLPEVYPLPLLMSAVMLMYSSIKNLRENTA